MLSRQTQEEAVVDVRLQMLSDGSKVHPPMKILTASHSRLDILLLTMSHIGLLFDCKYNFSKTCHSLHKTYSVYTLLGISR